MADNKLLVEFEFVIDLDLAMYKFIRENYSNSEYVDQEFIHLMNEKEIIYRLLNRKHINPLEIIIPNMDTTNMYYDILENHYEELLFHAKAYDTFGLMVTYLLSASSVDIDIWCRSNLEKKFINNLNPKLNTIVIPNRRDIPLFSYTCIYTKYLAYLVEYDKDTLNGKHIFIPAAKYNMEEDKDMVSSLCCLYSETNLIHLIDLYSKVKFRYLKKEGE